MGELADTFKVVCVDTATQMCEYSPIRMGVEAIDKRLDHLMRRYLKVLTTLAMVVLSESWQTSDGYDRRDEEGIGDI